MFCQNSDMTVSIYTLGRKKQKQSFCANIVFYIIFLLCRETTLVTAAHVKMVALAHQAMPMTSNAPVHLDTAEPLVQYVIIFLFTDGYFNAHIRYIFKSCLILFLGQRL